MGPVTEAAIEEKIFALLAARRPHATICPSEVARALVPNGGAWRELMPQVRQVARALARDGRIDVTRGGVAVDAMSRGGPIRLGRAAEGERSRTEQNPQRQPRQPAPQDRMTDTSAPSSRLRPAGRHATQ